jgi:hypothetical protein
MVLNVPSLRGPVDLQRADTALIGMRQKNMNRNGTLPGKRIHPQYKLMG